MESQLAPLKEFLTEIIRPIVNSAVQEAMPKPSEKSDSGLTQSSKHVKF